MPDPWKNRITRYADEAPDQLLASSVNFRVHPRHQQETMESILDDVGWLGHVLVSERSGYIIDGHMRAELALTRGEPTVPVAYVDVTPEEEARIRALYDAVGDMAVIDPRVLNAALENITTTRPAMMQALSDLHALANNLPQMEGLFPPSGIKVLGQGDEDGESEDEGAGGRALLGDPDAVPDAPAEQVTQWGDVWLLGTHRLKAGDAASRLDVDDLLRGCAPAMAWCDPPYGIGIVKTGFVGGGAAYDIPFGGTKNETPDERAARLKRLRGTDGASKPFGSKATRVARREHHADESLGAEANGAHHVVGTDGADHVVRAGLYAPVIGDDSTETAVAAYRLCADLGIPTLIFWGGNYYASSLPDSSCWIVWDKENTGDFADAELAWTNQKTAVRVFRHMWNGMLKASERGEKRIHPTQKPVALAVWCFQQYGTAGDAVLDLFGGSGTALIAAETMGNRTAYLMEMSEAYCDVICRRFQRATGILPILERTGQPHDFLADAPPVPAPASEASE